jgi:DNA-directed RNA polymerase subunit M/transcription elongation factor TFIIS
MSKPVFYQAVLTKLNEADVLRQTKGIPIDERMGKDAICPECGQNHWWLLPKQGCAVREGGKNYCECLGCGYTTHL